MKPHKRAKRRIRTGYWDRLSHIVKANTRNWKRKHICEPEARRKY